MLTETERHLHVAQEAFAEMPRLAGNVLSDVHTALLMRENGVRAIYTNDGDCNRFPSSTRQTGERPPVAGLFSCLSNFRSAGGI